MEFLLLWIDDLDDAIGALRHKAPTIVGFLSALTLFAVIGFALVAAPQITLTVLAAIACASLIEVARRRLRAVAERDRR